MRPSARTGALLASVVLLGPALARAPGGPGGSSGDERSAAAPLVALRAGTIHLVEDGRTLQGGATILVRDGKILAVGNDVAVPPGAELVDYGPDAVIVPGLVAATSPYATGNPPERTASPGLRAIDGFDFFTVYAGALSGGVTTAYVTPAEGRLIAGQGALVKLAGEDPAHRVLADHAAIHGAIDASARTLQGYWEVPIPATDATGIGFAKPQLPGSTMGAIVALGELVDGLYSSEKRTAAEREYGPDALRALAPLIEARVPWRIAAQQPGEIRALLEFARARKLPLIVDKASWANEVAGEIAAAGAAVVFQVPYDANTAAVDHGKDESDRWPRFDVPAALLRAGVRVAIAGSSPRDLLFFARLATRGGLSEDAALRAITLTPAELLGGAARVGSLRAGKDADFCVLNGPPLAEGSSVLATWVDGITVWSAPEGRSTVIEVDELHVGDGRVLRPGELLLERGRIVDVGERVSHPRGATVVRGRACMPGMIDALGHLGLEGSRKAPPSDFALKRIVGRPDAVDRRVARQGITTVVLSPRSVTGSGTPVMAYKPAASAFERQIVGDPVALRLRWTEENRLLSGQSIRDLLDKAGDYRKKWLDYQKALAAWTPPAAGSAEAKPAETKEKEGEKKKEESAGAGEEKKAEEKAEGKKEEEKKDEAKKDEKKDEKKEEEKKDAKKKKDHKDSKELEADPLTGVWRAELAAAPGHAAGELKLHLSFPAAQGSGKVVGGLRADALSSTLVEVEGAWDREAKTLALEGLGSAGWVEVTATLAEEKLTGKARCGEQELEFSAERQSKEYVVAKRSEQLPHKPETPQEPKGKPKEPRLDAKLEPLRRAMDGKLTVVVQVDRGDEILSCVDAFASHGIRPVLYGAHDAHLVAREIAGRVTGVLLSPAILDFDPKRGTDFVTPYAELQDAGVRVAFHSDAEEGAVDLPLAASFAVANGLSPEGALRALTSDAAAMMSISDHVGRLERGLDGDVLLLDGSPLDAGTSVLRTWVAGEEVEP